MTALDLLADEVGDTGPVALAGGRTQWDIGGVLAPGTRVVEAPAGVVDHQPDEMIVRVRAGTPLTELQSVLAERDQMVILDGPAGCTVGGVLSVGHSGLGRLRWGPVRDALLEARYVSAQGRLVKAGAPVVKNVTGFDLCRLLVGSLGTLGLLGEVVLRCQPRPRASVWMKGEGADPFAALERLHRPSSVLWDGRDTWVHVEGSAVDVTAEVSGLGPGWVETTGPPPLPGGSRRSVPPRELRSLTGRFVAEVGVGVVHAESAPPPPAAMAPELRAVNDEVKRRFDPEGRLNPGRRP